MAFLLKFFRKIIFKSNRVDAVERYIDPNNGVRSVSNIRIRPNCSMINNFTELEKRCRYCYMTTHPQSMIAPCKCTGSVKYVHIHCLERWKRIKNNPKKCEICNRRYIMPRNNRFIKTYSRYLRKQRQIERRIQRRRTALR